MSFCLMSHLFWNCHHYCLKILQSHILLWLSCTKIIRFICNFLEILYSDLGNYTCIWGGVYVGGLCVRMHMCVLVCTQRPEINLVCPSLGAVYLGFRGKNSDWVISLALHRELPASLVRRKLIFFKLQIFTLIYI